MNLVLRSDGRLLILIILIRILSSDVNDRLNGQNPSKSFIFLARSTTRSLVLSLKKQRSDLIVIRLIYLVVTLLDLI